MIRFAIQLRIGQIMTVQLHNLSINTLQKCIELPEASNYKFSRILVYFMKIKEEGEHGGGWWERERTWGGSSVLRERYC